jgi:hypothetical protein
MFLIKKSAIIRIYLRGSDDKYIINIILLFYSSVRRICKWDGISVNNNDDDDDINSKYIKSRFRGDCKGCQDHVVSINLVFGRDACVTQEMMIVLEY